MQKSNESGKISINTAIICDDLKSQDPLACMYALRCCALHNITDDIILSQINKLKTSTLVEWNSCRISDCAIAALHLLGAEPYSGNSPQILEMINTEFYAT